MLLHVARARYWPPLSPFVPLQKDRVSPPSSGTALRPKGTKIETGTSSGSPERPATMTGGTQAKTLP
ncbi:hypothetical protein TgHK011_004631 [Trichoderma gracile]|nr:hypothetical protein TgHK011_004631 [Trichoderma gracile]